MKTFHLYKRSLILLGALHFLKFFFLTLFACVFFVKHCHLVVAFVFANHCCFRYSFIVTFFCVFIITLFLSLPCWKPIKNIDLLRLAKRVAFSRFIKVFLWYTILFYNQNYLSILWICSFNLRSFPFAYMVNITHNSL